MSDRREHLSEKHTSRQLIHYSINGGIIQAGCVCMHIVRVYVCVRVCSPSMLVFMLTLFS